MDRFQNKIHFQRFAHRIGQDLLCAGVQDRGEVAESAAERDVCDVRQEDYYNNDRCQWDLAKLSPNEYYHYITTGEYPAGMLPLWVK